MHTRWSHCLIQQSIEKMYTYCNPRTCPCKQGRPYNRCLQVLGMCCSPLSTILQTWHLNPSLLWHFVVLHLRKSEQTHVDQRTSKPAESSQSDFCHICTGDSVRSLLCFAQLWHQTCQFAISLGFWSNDRFIWLHRANLKPYKHVWKVANTMHFYRQQFQSLVHWRHCYWLS